MMAQLVPGWDELVLDQYDWTPLDNWRLNRSAKYGQVVGGDFSEDQWLLDRMPYRMPVQQPLHVKRRVAGGSELDGGGLQRRPGDRRGRRGAWTAVVASPPM